MNGKLLEFLKKWDRSIVFLITLIIGTTVAWTTLKHNVEGILERQKVVIGKVAHLETKDAVHDEVHRTFEKMLERIELKTDRILQKVK